MSDSTTGPSVRAGLVSMSRRRGTGDRPHSGKTFDFNVAGTKSIAIIASSPPALVGASKVFQ